MYDRYVRNPAVLAAVFAVYFGLGKLGLAVGGFDPMGTALWPPSGFALGALILLGWRAWPAVFAGAFFVFATSTGYLANATGLAIGHTLEAIVGAVLVERFAGGPQAFLNAPSTFRFIAIAGLISTPISAAFGAGMTVGDPSLLSHAQDGLGAYAYVWMTLWLANLSGILVIAPVVLLWATTPWGRVRWAEVLEAVLLLAALVGVSFVVFGGAFPSDVKDYPLEFLCVPFLLWAAFRFGRREVASAVLLLTGIAVWGTLRGYGPFVRDSTSEALVLVQAYISVMGMTGVVLAAVVAQNKRAEAQLRELATIDPLTGLVNYRRLIELMKTEIARSRRTGRPFSVLFLDMNGLKAINDKYGHLAGSRALSRVAEALRQTCRSIDTPARYGGDEFAVVLPETPEEGALVVLKRVSDRLAGDPGPPVLSVSGGVAEFPRDGDSPTLLLRAADKTLYEAKARARSSRS